MTGTAGGFGLQTASIARLCLERRHQAGEPDEIEDATQIVGERSQAELTAHLLQTSHQERTLVHPLLDRSRRLEAETHRNIEVIWLLRHLKPDFKTIADFRRDNCRAFRQA